MTATQDLSDRDLCLALAERLGWEINQDGAQPMVLLPGPTRALLPPEMLLTPAGYDAVLNAMRERGRHASILDGKGDLWYVKFYSSAPVMGLHVKRERLARAICEAAYLALGDTDDRAAAAALGVSE